MRKPRTPEARVTRYLLLVIIAAFLALTLVYSLTVPLFEGPDEIWHYAFANHLANGGGLPVFDATRPATYLRNGAHPPLYYALIAALIAPIDRVDFPADYRFNLANPRITPGASGASPNLLIHTAREDFPFHNTALAGHLARLVSIALGAVTVVGVFGVARRLLDDERLALVATAFVAFIPQFVYGTALVNNDTLAAASATWLLYTLLRLKDDGRWAVASGILLGITLLSKIGMIAALPIPALLLGLMYFMPRRNRATGKTPESAPGPRVSAVKLLINGLVIYGVAVLIAGWWYARNFALYGDPLMWREWQVLTGTGRVPPTPIDFLRDMLGFFGLFWADFSLRVDRVLWPVFGMLVLAAIGGLIRRAIKRQWPALDWPGLLVALAWLGLLIAAAVRYSFNIYDIHGRLLYPALAAIGVMLALGLSGWPKPRWVMGIALAIMMSLAVLAPFAIVQPAYARPIVSVLPEGVTKTSVPFGVVELVGYRFNGERFNAGDMVKVETYWRRIPNTVETANAYGTLALDQNQQKAPSHVEEMLGGDNYPVWAWQPDELIVTRFGLPAQADATGVVNADLSVRVDPPGIHPTDVSGTTRLARVVVYRSQPCDSDTEVNITFGGSIRLVGYRIDRSTAPGASLLILCWQSVKPVEIDYTVFVHAVDSRGAPSNDDSQPQGGDSPTSVWLSGDQIKDIHRLPADARQISIGLYRLDTGERLSIDGSGATEFELIK